MLSLFWSDLFDYQWIYQLSCFGMHLLSIFGSLMLCYILNLLVGFEVRTSSSCGQEENIKVVSFSLDFSFQQVGAGLDIATR